MMNATPKSFAALCVLLTSLLLSSQSAFGAVAGQVQFANGNVQVTTLAGATRPLKKGDVVNEGDSVSTAFASSAQIKMLDGGFVAIRPDTQMKFDKFVFSGKADGTERGFFSVVKGGFRAVTGLVGRVNKSNYKIFTSAATIGIRGTDHETFVVPAGNPMAAAGAYSKVNVGETTLTTNLGTVNVLPNQMGFAGGMNEPPKLAPINTTIFTVSATPTKTMKESSEEKKESDKQEQKSDKPGVKDEKAAGKEEKPASAGEKTDKAGTQEAKQEAAKQDGKQEDAKQEPAQQEGKQDAPPANKQEAKQAGAPSGGGAASAKAAAGAVASVAGGAIAASPSTETPSAAPADTGAGSIRVTAMTDAPSGGKIGAGNVAPPPPATPVAAVVPPPPAAPPVQAAPIKMADASGNTVNATTQSISTLTGESASVTSVATQISAPPSGSTGTTSLGAAIFQAVTSQPAPTISVCTSNPSAAGCALVLPTLAACTSSPTAAGCSVVLPTLATCASTPSVAGCSVVLPSIATCISTPSATGCSAVLPTLTACISTPGAAGCSVVLPSAATCTSMPSTPGCSAVVIAPTCAATPSAAGCSAAYVANRVAVSESNNSWGTIAAPADMVYVTGVAGGLSSSGALRAYTDRSIGGGFSNTVTVNGGSASSSNATSFSTSGIQYGAWSGYTSITQSNTGVLGTNNGGGLRSWMYGPEGYLDAAYKSASGTPTGAMAGTFTYQMDGATAPYNQNTGATGTLTSASITANFSTMTANANVALTMPGNDNWGVSVSNQAIFGGQFWATPTVTHSTGAGVALAACATCSGWLNAAFTGQNYAGALLSYQLNNAASGAGNNIFGNVALTRNAAGNTNPLVANGTAAPTGNLLVATNWGSVTSYPLASTTIAGNVLTQFSNAFNATTITCATCTATAAGQVASNGIYYGDWTRGTYTDSWTNTGTGTVPYYWITGPEAGPVYLAQSLTGTANFAFDSGKVSNGNGVAGTVQGTTALTVNFTKQTVGINLDVSIADTAATPVVHVWNAKTLAGNEAPLTGSNGIGSDAFHASGGGSATSTGSGLLTITVDGVAPTSAFGSISGQLTGTGLNGAIMSFNLTGQITATALTQNIQGVVAFGSAGSTVATPHQYVEVAYFDAATSMPLLGFDANNSARVTKDAAGNLTQFDSSFINNGSSGSHTISANTSTAADFGSDSASGMSWGRRVGGVINSTNRATGVVTPITNAGSLHWITEPVTSTAVTLPLSGTYAYTKVGGTKPTDNLGNVGTLNTATLSANFSAQLVNIALNATVNGATLDAVALTAPIIQNSVFYANSNTPTTGLTVTCTGATCGTGISGEIIGSFNGAGAAGVAVSYGLQHGTSVVSGVAAFAGQAFVQPTLASCTANPTSIGCSAILPTLATCTATPSTAGCSAVLPTLSTCTSAPATTGCGAVLPTQTACTANPAAAGCSAVISPLAACTANPAATGCSTVLPQALALSMQDVYGSSQIWNSTFTTAPGNVSTATPTPSFAMNWGGGGTNTITLGGASGAVNGNATSFASTGIQFGRYASVSSITQDYSSSFGNQFNGNRPGQWAYGVTGYLDTPTTLSAAVSGAVTGTFGYVLDGTQTAPMDQNGNKGVLNSLTLTANFASNTVDSAIKATMGSTIWNASATGMSFGGTHFYIGGGAGTAVVATQTSSITKGVLGTETCLTCSWSLQGGFTGQNYAGAVIAYSLRDAPASGSYASVDGVAVMTRTGGTVGAVANPVVANAAGTVAATTTEVATAGASVGVGVHTESSVTVNAGNVLTTFGTPSAATGGVWSNVTAITCTTCTSAQAPGFASTGIRFGTWDAGSVSQTWTNSLTSGAQIHWISGPAAPAFLAESLLGTATYTLDGGTAPTAQAFASGFASTAVTGTLSSASLAVDFNKQSVAINFALAAGGHNWVVSSPNAPIGSSNGVGASAFKASSQTTGSGALSVTLDGVAVTNTLGLGSFVSGQLTGAALNGALLQYELTATQAPVAIPNTFSATDSVTSQAPAVTITGPAITGLPSTPSFPAGTGATFAVQAATTTNLVLSAGVPTSLTTTGGVPMTVAALTAGAAIPGAYSGLAATGERVDVRLYGSLVSTSGAVGGLAYSNFGAWRKYQEVTALAPAALTGTYSSTEFAGGSLLTSTTAMPTALTASYFGVMQGSAQNSVSNTPYSLSGTVSLAVNFTSAAVTGSMTGISSTDQLTNVAAGNFNDIALAGTITGNGFSGTVTAGPIPAVSPSPIALATGAVTTGTASGHFYGPSANEVTGIWALSSGTIQASGAYGAANGTSSNPSSQQSVNGVVALSQTAVNGTAGTINPATVSSRFVAFTNTDPVKGFQANGALNNSTRVAVDATANVTGFDAGNNGGGNQNVYSTTQAVAIDAAVVKNDTGADALSGISWGRWTGGNLTLTDKVTAVVTSVANTNTHWIAGPTTVGQVALPVSGTFTYTLSGGTKPTDNLGNAGTLNSATLAANFTAQTVNVGVNATVNAVNYVSTATNLPIQNAQFSNGNGGTFAATANNVATTGFVGGVFTGATANGAAVVYGFQSGATTVNGVAAFRR